MWSVLHAENFSFHEVQFDEFLFCEFKIDEFMMCNSSINYTIKYYSVYLA